MPRYKANVKKVSIIAVCLDDVRLGTLPSYDGHDDIYAPRNSIIRPCKGSLDTPSSVVVPGLASGGKGWKWGV